MSCTVGGRSRGFKKFKLKIYNLQITIRMKNEIKNEKNSTKNTDKAPFPVKRAFGW